MRQGAVRQATGGLPLDRLRVPQALWRALDHLGLRPSAVLRQARLPATLRLASPGLVTTAQMFAIWHAVEAPSADPAFAFRMVEASDAAGHQPAFLAACYAADFRDAVSRVARFKGLGACELFRLDERHGEATVSKDWPHASEPEPALLIDMSFAYLLALGRRGTGAAIAPLRVDFERPDPGGNAHRAHFGCPIRWGAPRNPLVLRSSDLDRPFPGHSREFLDLVTPALAAALGEMRAGSSTGEQVKVVLKRALASGRPEVAGVARELGLSERTLQRRITEEGTTFRALLAEARAELGRQLLSDPFVGLDEVACLLGYQDTSSFHRGFREWEGTTPSQWRALDGVGARGRGPTALLHWRGGARAVPGATLG